MSVGFDIKTKVQTSNLVVHKHQASADNAWVPTMVKEQICPLTFKIGLTKFYFPASPCALVVYIHISKERKNKPRHIRKLRPSSQAKENDNIKARNNSKSLFQPSNGNSITKGQQHCSINISNKNLVPRVPHVSPIIMYPRITYTDVLKKALADHTAETPGNSNEPKSSPPHTVTMPAEDSNAAVPKASNTYKLSNRPKLPSEGSSTSSSKTDVDTTLGIQGSSKCPSVEPSKSGNSSDSFRPGQSALCSPFPVIVSLPSLLYQCHYHHPPRQTSNYPDQERRQKKHGWS